MLDGIIVRSVYVGQSGSEECLGWTERYRGVFILDRVVVRSVYVGQSGSEECLCWTER